MPCCHRCSTLSYRNELTTASTEHGHKFCLLCLLCSLCFSMALQPFLLSLLVLNMCWRSESACTMADWWAAFDRKGWAACDFPSQRYIKGLWRNHNGGPREKIYLLEQGKCCSPPRPYERTLSKCKIADWWGVLDK